MEREALILGHLARKRMMIGLRKWDLVSTALNGKTRDVVKELKGSSGDVLSSDLRAASDLIPLDVSDAMAKGLEASGRFTDTELLGLKRCIGPQDLEWEDLNGLGTGITRATSSRVVDGFTNDLVPPKPLPWLVLGSRSSERPSQAWPWHP
jgi:hypothetical protein